MDKALDNLIFNEKKDDAPPSPTKIRRSSTGSVDHNPPNGVDDDDMDNGVRKSIRFDRASIVNAIPVDRLKNGANTASKLLGQALSSAKEKSTAAYEAAKASNAGSAVAGGISRAAAVSSEHMSKVKESDAFKKTSEAAGSALGKGKVIASIGFEKAKSGAASGIETIKSKVGGSDKKGGE